MPRIRVTFRPKISLLVPGKGKPGWATYRAFFTAFSKWSEELYPQVIARAPRYKGQDPRRMPGFVVRHIKLIWSTGPMGIRYKCIGVPGGSKKGTPAYHALMAIYALHNGWRSAFVRRPRRAEVMTFPLRAGESFKNPKTAAPPPFDKEGPKTWVVTKRARQVTGPKRNPWIDRIFKENLRKLIFYWNMGLGRVRREVRKYELS